MTRFLVTGASGFLGRHVLAALAAEDCNAVSRIDGDLTDSSYCRALVEATRPTHVIHLAGTVGDRGTVDHVRANIEATAVLLDALAEEMPGAWVGLAGSSAVYGAADSLPANESHPLLPRTAYAASKCAQEVVGLHHDVIGTLRVASIRMFNLIGPGQPDRFVLAALARQVADVERGARDVIEVGNLDTKRDFVDVRDAAEAVVKVAHSGMRGPVNVATGRSTSVRELLELLRSLTTASLRIAEKPGRSAQVEILEQRGDPDRLASATRWRPAHSIEDSVRDVLDEWRQSG